MTWLAALLYALDVERPRGASANTGRVGALMASSGDFASGRRARPGRLLSAQMLGVNERTVERQWRIIERLELAAMTAAGRHLSAEQFAAITDQGEQARWRDRQEWHLVLTASWLAEVPVDELEPYKERARALLADLAGVSLVDNPEPRDVGGSSRVAPSRRGSSLLFRSGGQGFLYKPTNQNGTRPDGRTEQPGAASRPPSSRSRSGPARTARVDRRMPREAVQLVRELLARGRLPWLYRTRRPVVVAALRRYAAAGWTARDVEVAVNNHLQSGRFSVPVEGPERPVSYLLWLLSSSDLERPPAQAQDAVVTAAAAEQTDRQRVERARAREVARAAVTAAELEARNPEFAALRAAVRAPAGAGRRSTASWEAEERAAAAARARGEG